MDPRNILLIGGSGFIGSHVAEKLTERGLSLRVPTRRRERAKHLLLLPSIELVEANVHDQRELAALCEGMDTVINLVGILQSRSGEPYGADFRVAHVDLPTKILAACRAAGIGRLVHLSALHAAADAPSEYLRSKAAGEEAVLGTGGEIAVTVFRPSVVFGPEDKFLNLFARLQRTLPVVFLACPEARFQPVFAGDVARAIVESLSQRASFGNRYDLVGPRAYTLRELVGFAGAAAGHRRPIVGLSAGLGKLQAMAMEFLPGKLLSRDNVRSMQIDSTSSAPFPFGIIRGALEAIAPEYLSGISPRRQYMALRGRAGR
jgi:NADH dehydrogenase